MEYLLSWIIPVYNRKDYIGEAMDSVLCQLPQDYECIVVDDGSDDGTKKCLQSLDSHQENVRIIYADHQGAGFAGNTEGSAFSRRRMEIKKPVRSGLSFIQCLFQGNGQLIGT